MVRAKLRAFCLTLALVCSFAGSYSTAAHAEDSTPETLTSTPRWYGYQTLAVDGAALATLATAAAATPTSAARNGLSVIGLGTYGLGAPIVHLLRHAPGKAIGDLALRVLTPAATGVTAQLLVHHETISATEKDHTGAIAAGVGGLIAIAIDAAVLAREDIRPQFEIRAPGTKKSGLMAMEPTVDLPKGGVSAGIHGVF